MEKVELFEVLIKTIGFIVFLRGLNIPFLVVLRIARVIKTKPTYPLEERLALAASYIVIGILLMHWAEGVAKMLYD